MIKRLHECWKNLKYNFLAYLMQELSLTLKCHLNLRMKNSILWGGGGNTHKNRFLSWIVHSTKETTTILCKVTGAHLEEEKILQNTNEMERHIVIILIPPPPSLSFGVWMSVRPRERGRVCVRVFFLWKGKV